MKYLFDLCMAALCVALFAMALSTSHLLDTPARSDAVADMTKEAKLQNIARSICGRRGYVQDATIVCAP